MQRHYLADIIEPVVEKLGYEVVRILTIGEANPTLQIMIEHKNYEEELTVDNCAEVSRAVSATLDELDPIENRYTLEVSSPGLDRPLTKPEHFERYKGYLIKLETLEPVEKRKRFKGTIKEVAADNNVMLEMENITYSIPFANIAKAKIIITDELWEQFLKSQKTPKA
ncbi:MAG: ribosome maturation factor RimP [Alphaproteobacteria bacterium]|nr:ribosome maturation factor RimP [Alphaproteobacteria bacterium]